MARRLRQGKSEARSEEGDEAESEERHVGRSQRGEKERQLENVFSTFEKYFSQVGRLERDTCGATMPPSLANREHSPKV